MVIFEDGRIAGTIGGGKFESLVIEEAQKAMATGKAILKTYPLHVACRTSIPPFAVCQNQRQKHLSAPTNGLNAMHSFSSVAITISTGKPLLRLSRREAWGILE